MPLEPQEHRLFSDRGKVEGRRKIERREEKREIIHNITSKTLPQAVLIDIEWVHPCLWPAGLWRQTLENSNFLGNKA
jgi:hypothetical protein